MKIKAYILLFCFINIIFPASANESLPPDEWLVDKDGQTSENYFFENSEKLEKLDKPWQEVSINNQRAKISFPWQPDDYEVPNIYGANIACIHKIYLANIDESLTFMAMTMRCPDISTHKIDMRRRFKASRKNALKNERVLLDERKLNINNGFGAEMFVRDKFGYHIKSRIILHEKSTYVLAVSTNEAKKKLELSFTSQFLESLKIKE